MAESFGDRLLPYFKIDQLPFVHTVFCKVLTDLLPVLQSLQACNRSAWEQVVAMLLFHQVRLHELDVVIVNLVATSVEVQSRIAN